VRVVDGDTVVLDIDLGFHLKLEARPVRLAKINAPELHEPAGKIAADYVHDLLPAGKQVTLESHSLDKYGRILGSIGLPDGFDLATMLLGEGYASPWDGHSPRPQPPAS
jgi:micrococcal nuclease